MATTNEVHTLDSDSLVTAPPSETGDGRAITVRSVLIALVMVAGICALTPYNDYVIANTFLVGCYLPLVVVLSFFLLGVAFNAPMHRFRPNWALSGGELAVIMALVLVGCAIPSSGLMRYIPGTLATPFNYGATDDVFWKAFKSLGLPDWLFPVPISDESRYSRVIVGFFNRVPPDETIPFAPWVIPLLGWGVFFLGWMFCLVALAVILRPQWGTNERLPFPLAQLELALIQPPRPGHILNDLFRNRSLWLSLVLVFALQSLTVLNIYFPKTVPAIPLRFDLNDVLTREPWRYLPGDLKAGRIFFTFVGVTYLLQARVSFSLWGVFVLLGLISMQASLMGSEISDAARLDQHLGSGVAFLTGVLWVGRQQWVKVGRHLLFGISSEERQRGQPSYRGLACLLLLGCATMLGWLWLVGLQLWVAVFLIAFILISHLVVARIVAETGLPFIRFQPVTTQITNHFPAGLLGGRDIYFVGALQAYSTVCTRESLLPYAMHGLQVADSVEPPVRRRVGLIVLMMLVWVIGFAVAATSHLYCHYTNAVPLAQYVQDPVNSDGTSLKPRLFLLEPIKRWAAGTAPVQSHSSALHITLGAVVTLGLHAGALRWASWPILPVGFLVSPTWYMALAWFSILLGWMCKVLIVRFGGYALYQRARPLFIGAIFGEALAAAFWLLVNFYLAQNGYDYRNVMFLPN